MLHALLSSCVAYRALGIWNSNLQLVGVSSFKKYKISDMHHPRDKGYFQSRLLACGFLAINISVCEGDLVDICKFPQFIT